jgi:predicted RNase H-like nuclease (RuvC/YqgF family)
MNSNYKIISALIIIGLTPIAHADIYKWKDAQGVTHYGDTMPPQAAGRATIEMNKKGNIIKETAAALTPEQRAQNDAEQAKLKKDAQTLTEQKRHDSALLNTYTSPAEIDLARDRSLEQYKLVIDGTNAQLAPLRDKQSKLSPKSAEYAENMKRISDLEGVLTQKNTEMAATKAKFAADRARYIELTGKQ